MVDAGQYFTINRARQYGKTTTLHALTKYLKTEYVVVSLDFQMMSTSKFKDENSFSSAFAKMFIREMEASEGSVSQPVKQLKRAVSEKKEETELPELFEYLSEICGVSSRPIRRLRKMIFTELLCRTGISSYGRDALRPIINGTGNYYIEARTRNLERTDVSVDYRGEQ